MAKFKRMLICLIMICLPLSGCYDATEIDEEVYALAIGVDKGVNNAIRVTFQYATYTEGPSGGKGGGGSSQAGNDTGEVTGTIVSTVEAASLLEGINLMNAAVNRQISLTHAKMLVFSEEFAREGVARYIEPIMRFREVREFMRVVVCKGKASDFIKENKTLVGSNPSKAMDLMFEQSKNSGYFPDTVLTDFYGDMLTPYGQPTAIYADINDHSALVDPEGNKPSPLYTKYDIEPGQIPRQGGTKKDLFGTALFDGDRMVGTLSQNETRLFLMAIGEFRRGFFTFADQTMPEYAYVLEIQPGRTPSFSAQFENSVPVIKLSLVLDADIVALQSRKHYEKMSNIREFTDQVQTQIQQELAETIRKTQEYNVDIFHFGKKVAGNFRTINQFEQYDWLANYENAQVNVEVKLNLRRSGFIFGASPIKTTDGKIGEEDKK